MKIINKHPLQLIASVWCMLCAVVFLWVSPTLSAENIRINPVVTAVKKVGPAVVNISSEYEVRKQTNPFSRFQMDPLFDSFFRDFFDPGHEQRYKRSSLGSGVIIDGRRGFILTNAHVTAKSSTISVVLQDKREFSAKIVGADPDSDLAVLQIDTTELLPAIEMGNSDDLMIGETVIAIGNPFGFSNTVTTGVISALNRSIRTDARVYQDFIQTDASINPGNSGGPLLNINGSLIGINTAIYAKAQGIGFAIPINKAKRIVSDLIRYGEVIFAWIGITVQDIDDRLGRYLKLPQKKGVLVTGVEENSPAQQAGIREGDMLLSMGLQSIGTKNEYQAAAKSVVAGQTIEIHLLRKRLEKTVSVRTAVFPLELAMDLAYKILGVKVESLTAKNRLKYKTKTRSGVVISAINPRSYLAQVGARPGDIIRQLDEKTIENSDDFKKAVIQYRQKTSIILLLQRGGRGYYITVKP